MISFSPAAFGLSGLGAYGDLDWFQGALDEAKTTAANTGNVDGARAMANKAYSIAVNSNPPTTQPQINAMFASAVNYIQTFKKGSSILSSGYSSSTGAIQSYHAAHEDEYAQERDDEAYSLAMAQSSPWAYKLGLDKPALAAKHALAAAERAVSDIVGSKYSKAAVWVGVIAGSVYVANKTGLLKRVFRRRSK